MYQFATGFSILCSHGVFLMNGVNDGADMVGNVLVWWVDSVRRFATVL
jgi:hypothetical protein